MDLSQVPVFAALMKRMEWLTDRQAVLAQNVANADTPGYVGHDLKEPDFRQYLSQTTSQVALATTQPGHIAVQQDITDTAERETTDESSGDGRRASVEEEMMKVSQTANDYALVTTVYRANLNLVKTVIGGSF